MAVPQAKQSRVRIVLESTNEIPSNKPSKGRCEPACTTVEHLVLFNMPYLQGDQESIILQALYNLRFKFDNILVLIAGRLLEKQDNVTHALFMRFPSFEILREYYNSEALSDVATLMRPFIIDEFTNDYISTSRYLDCYETDPKYATLTFLRNKRDVCAKEVECALHCLVSTMDDETYVKDFTAGSNLFTRREEFYTHGFAVYVNSVDDLDKMAKNCHYSKVLHDKVLPLSANTLTVSVMAFKPIISLL